MEIKLNPIAFVRNKRISPTDDFWGEVISEIELADQVPSDAFEGISAFSHLEIIYHFNKSNPGDIIYSGRPRGNPSYPITGIFAQRKRDRPNAIGLCTVQLIEHSGRSLKVMFLDAIDGTPILDIKPVMKEFQARGEIRQPFWATDLMKDYWL
jgi:tRNA-Thr(GGU) m(6)t(6)A37 methyltransferase TsaA